MEFNNLSFEQLRSLCFEMSKVHIFQETESAFSNLFGLLEMPEPPGFDYDEDPGARIYSRLEDIATNLLTEKYVIMALFYPSEFTEQENPVLSDFMELPGDSSEDALASFFSSAADSYF